jgi:hypothetical protein
MPSPRTSAASVRGKGIQGRLGDPVCGVPAPIDATACLVPIEIAVRPHQYAVNWFDLTPRLFTQSAISYAGVVLAFRTNMMTLMTRGSQLRRPIGPLSRTFLVGPDGFELSTSPLSGVNTKSGGASLPGDSRVAPARTQRSRATDIHGNPPPDAPDAALLLTRATLSGCE